MSFPFGGHPTLNQYLRWAEQAGCAVKSGVASDADGRPVSVILVENPKGGHVFIVDVPEREYLTPSMVAHYDRRLNLQSGFPALEAGRY